MHEENLEKNIAISLSISGFFKFNTISQFQ